MKSTKNLKISVLISAYNEEHSIASVLTGVLSQQVTSGVLTEILVYCDGCTDNTVKNAKSVQDDRIKIYINTHRQGKTYCLQQMFKKMCGDVACFFDADIEFSGPTVIAYLLEKLTESSSVALVGGNSRPKPGTSFFERSVYTTFLVFDESRHVYLGGNNIFGCTGSCLAATRSFLNTVTFPKSLVNEDAYMYFSCVSSGKLFRYAPDAVIYYFLPKNLHDYLRQVFRSEPRAVYSELEKHFPQYVKEHLIRNTWTYAKSVLGVFLRYPFEVAYISFINFLCLPFLSLLITRYKLTWFTATSSHRKI